AARLAEENEYLRTELTRMEECAEGWCNEAQHLHQQLAEATGGLRQLLVEMLGLVAPPFGTFLHAGQFGAQVLVLFGKARS
ncbi:hypothetical protein F7O93_37470, partial [Pseudomonas aeruginosa]